MMIKMKYHYYKKNEDKFVRVIGTYDEKNKTVMAQFRSDEPKNFKKIKYSDFVKNKDNYELIIGSFDEIDRTVAVLERGNKDLLFERGFKVILHIEEDNERGFNTIIQDKKTNIYYLCNTDKDLNVKCFYEYDREYERMDWEGGGMYTEYHKEERPSKPLKEITKKDYEESFVHNAENAYEITQYTFSNLGEIKTYMLEEIEGILRDQKKYLIERVYHNQKYWNEFGEPGFYKEYDFIRKIIRKLDNLLNEETDIIKTELDDFFIIDYKPVRLKYDRSL